jgi:hypothetical protein
MFLRMQVQLNQEATMRKFSKVSIQGDPKAFTDLCNLASTMLDKALSTLFRP